jgi:DNA-binding IscR family transcriptional regulator
MADNEKMIMDAMKKAGKPVKAGEVAQVVGLDQKEVAKIIAGLKKQGKVISPKNCFYAPA